MEHLPHGTKLRQSPNHMKLSADSVLLAAACPRARRAVDLGCGVGNVLFGIADRRPDCALTGVELNPDAAALARETVAENSLEPRARVITGDLREIESLLPPQCADLVASNPPYLRDGTSCEPSSPARALERIDRTAPPTAVARAASYLLRSGGALCLVLRPERLCDYVEALRANNLPPRSLRLVSHRPTDPPCLALLRADKARAANFTVLPLFSMAKPDGTISDEYSAVLSGEPLKL